MCANEGIWGISKALTVHRGQLRVLYALEGLWQDLLCDNGYNRLSRIASA